MAHTPAPTQADIDRLTATIVADDAKFMATIARLQGHELVVAANVGGWFSAPFNANTATERTRIVGTFSRGGDKIPGVRDWPMSLTWTWAQRQAMYAPGTSLFVDFPVSWQNMINPVQADLDNFRRVCQTAPTTGRHWIAVGHEWDVKSTHGGITPAQHRAGMAQYSAIFRQYAPSNLHLVVVLTGSTFVASRLGWSQGAGSTVTALDWFTGLDIDAVGADVYQEAIGATDGVPNSGTPDTAALGLGPVLDVARALGKRVVLGEWGVRASEHFLEYNAKCSGITDAKMALYLRDGYALMRANPEFEFAAVFEAFSSPTWKNPSCVTAPPDWAGGDAAWAPLALAVVQDEVAVGLAA